MSVAETGAEVEDEEGRRAAEFRCSKMFGWEVVDSWVLLGISNCCALRSFTDINCSRPMKNSSYLLPNG